MYAGVAELVDAPDSKSGGCKPVGVRVPPSVLFIITIYLYFLIFPLTHNIISYTFKQ